MQKTKKLTTQLDLSKIVFVLKFYTYGFEPL